MPHARPKKVITVAISSSMHSGIRASADGVVLRGRHEEEEDDDADAVEVMVAFIPMARRSHEAWNEQNCTVRESRSGLEISVCRTKFTDIAARASGPSLPCWRTMLLRRRVARKSS